MLIGVGAHDDLARRKTTSASIRRNGNGNRNFREKREKSAQSIVVKPRSHSKVEFRVDVGHGKALNDTLNIGASCPTPSGGSFGQSLSERVPELYPVGAFYVELYFGVGFSPQKSIFRKLNLFQVPFRTESEPNIAVYPEASILFQPLAP